MLPQLRKFLNTLPDNHTFLADKFGADFADAVEMLREFEAQVDDEESEVA